MTRRLRSMTGIFRDLQANRRTRNAVWGVIRTDRPYKRVSATCETEQEARAIAENMERLNPGMRFAVCPV